jgi:RHS repeat-associated protein
VDGSNPLRMYQPIRMQGQHYDEESGLHYNRHRYYDPTLGRYITQDPIGLLGGWNLYRYTSNPLQGVDPLGLSEFGKWAGSAFNLPEDQIAAALDVANGPLYSPPEFSLSVDVGIAGYGFLGGSIAAGIVTGNNGKGLDLCAYLMACQGAGVGISGAASISGTVSNAPPTSGVSYLSGATTDIGFLLNGTATNLLEINGSDKPLNISSTLGAGLGGGSFTGGLTCQQYTRCVLN